MSQLTLSNDPLGSATTGTFEFATPAFYLTPATSQRGVVLADQYIIQQATYTLTAGLAANAPQKLFSTTNGAVTLVTGTYEFECQFSLSSLSATSGSFGFALGGGATFTQYWWSLANKATLATAAAPQLTYNVAANTTIATASTATVGYARVGGLIIVTAGGTVIPQVSQSVTSVAAVVGIGSYFKIRALGDSAATTSGNWS